jgi:hypothetical protein
MEIFAYVSLPTGPNLDAARSTFKQRKDDLSLRVSDTLRQVGRDFDFCSKTATFDHKEDIFVKISETFPGGIFYYYFFPDCEQAKSVETQDIIQFF